MADESGNQTLGVRHETGAATAAGLDGGAGGSTGLGADTGHGITDASETDPMTSGASRTREVDRNED